MGEHGNGHEGGEHGGGEHHGPLGLMGHIAHYVGAGAHALHHPAVHHALEHAGKFGHAVAGPLGKALPYVGAVAGTAQAGIEGYEAYEAFKEGGAHSDKAWEKVGGSALGGAGAALSFTPYGAALGLGELAVDGLGALSGKVLGEDASFNSAQVVGGAIRGMVGDKSLGWQAGSAVSNALGGGFWGNAAGVATGAVTNVAAAPVNALNTVGGGIVNWVGNALDSTPGKQDYWGQGLNAVGGAISSGASAVGGAISSGAGAVGRGLGRAANWVGSLF